MKFDFVDTAGSIVATPDLSVLRQVGGVDVYATIAIYQGRYFILTPGGYGPDYYTEESDVETIQ